MVRYLTQFGFVFLLCLGFLNAHLVDQQHESADKELARERSNQLLNVVKRSTCSDGLCLSKYDFCGDGRKSGSCYGGSIGGGNIPPPTTGNQRSGQGTYYDPGLSTCGIDSSGSELVCTMAAPDFDPQTPNGNPNRNSLCGRLISVNGPRCTVTVKIVDRCPVCASGDLDLSPAAFNQIGDPIQGRIHIQWSFI